MFTVIEACASRNLSHFVSAPILAFDSESCRSRSARQPSRLLCGPVVRSFASSFSFHSEMNRTQWLTRINLVGLFWCLFSFSLPVFRCRHILAAIQVLVSGCLTLRPTRAQISSSKTPLFASWVLLTGRPTKSGWVRATWTHWST